MGEVGWAGSAAASSVRGWEGLKAIPTTATGI